MYTVIIMWSNIWLNKWTIICYSICQRYGQMCFTYWSVYGALKRISNTHVPKFLILYWRVWIRISKKKKEKVWVH